MAEIILLTGDLQSGKTNLCLEIHQLAQEAGIRVGGMISPAVFIGDKKAAIDVLNLKSGIRKRLAELRTSHQSGLETQRWSFDPVVVDWGNKMLKEAVPCDLLLIDELGPLEFHREEGWVNGFDVIDSGEYSTAVIVIRPSLIEEAARRERLLDGDETGLVGQQVTDRHVSLAGLRELGPVGRNGFIERDFALVDETEDGDGGHCLADGVDVDEGVALPGTGAIFVEPARPEVDD